MSNLNEKRAIFVYEGVRLRSIAAGAAIVPEPWEGRDGKWQAHFVTAVQAMCDSDPQANPTPEASSHEAWIKDHEAMGWKYGPVRDAATKTHPNMVPFNQLPPVEQSKDAVFLALCKIARETIV